MVAKLLQRTDKILVAYHDLEFPLEKSGYGPVLSLNLNPQSQNLLYCFY